ncbi:MAG: MBL fold metallo-hydrolase, partial [Gemmatimonadetes bacterium]|nr:MBL fold metallo-hydrolase [Gemmatimonadota bacterium]NIR77195.1 MBL fold metallo-hydrolase [Gemmatimonadota bacterium]NIT85710.1 MBL fold metallo-hydrolase [Gemmatimonadota bacterium]NIU29541.1 MBL fold metallo-hydrolase [Gemmatimonadota bacterium]NIV59955.1 MBL fold metallo-hydrolase [Gemmatimonadota bacterium]
MNTHGHGDHVWGNVAYREAFPGVVFVGHADLDQELEGEGVERLREERERVDVVVEARLRALAEAERGAGDPAAGEEEIARLRWSLRVNRGYREDLVDLPLIPPDMEVEDPLTLDLGGREVRVLALGPAHTRTDAVVWLPEEEIVASGDLVEEGIPWFGDAHPRGWAEALGVLAA